MWGISAATPTVTAKSKHRRLAAAALVAVTALLLGLSAGAEDPPIWRIPAWPLKDTAALYSPEQIAAARIAAASDSGAKSLLASARYASAPYLDLSDQELHDLLPDWRVPRAFDVSSTGSPAIGVEVYKFGTYPWILPFYERLKNERRIVPEERFKIKCPVTGEIFPSNDFNAFYLSGMSDRSLLIGEFPDDGRGFDGGGAEKFWLAAYANHWNWLNSWLPPGLRRRCSISCSRCKGLPRWERFSPLFALSFSLSLRETKIGRVGALYQARRRGRLVWPDNPP